MKLVRYDEGSIGVVQGGRVIDVSTSLGIVPDQWPPIGMTRLIAEFAHYEPILRELAAAGGGKPLNEVKLLTPVPWPNKVVAFPVNYHDHAVEMGARYRATNQGFFLKPPSSLSGAGESIVLPEVKRRIDHECELAIIIGKEARNIAPGDWKDYVFGYSCLIDVVVRGKEERVARKAYDTFCPVGPWIVTADEVGDPTALRGRLWVNDELRQDANTKDLVLDIPGMIHMASAVMTLYPGDIIATGTPAGVGPIRAGDRVRIEFERVGEMTINVVQGVGGYTDIFAEKPGEL